MKNKESRIEKERMAGIRPSQVSIVVQSNGNWTLRLSVKDNSEQNFIPAHGQASTPEEAFKAAYKAAQDLADWDVPGCVPWYCPACNKKSYIAESSYRISGLPTGCCSDCDPYSGATKF